MKISIFVQIDPHATFFLMGLIKPKKPSKKGAAVAGPFCLKKRKKEKGKREREKPKFDFSP